MDIPFEDFVSDKLLLKQHVQQAMLEETQLKKELKSGKLHVSPILRPVLEVVLRINFFFSADQCFLLVARLNVFVNLGTMRERFVSGYHRRRQIVTTTSKGMLKRFQHLVDDRKQETKENVNFLT